VKRSQFEAIDVEIVWRGSAKRMCKCGKRIIDHTDNEATACLELYFEDE